MGVTTIDKDLAAATMTVTAELDAPVDRAWQLWADPRQLERWWGPPTWPATVHEHDLSVGGRVAYEMNGPDGGSARGLWRVVAVDAPRRLEVEDLFADEHGEPNESMPVTRMVVTLVDRDGGGTTARIESTFPSTEAMAQMIEMGMDEGMGEAMGQIDAILAE